MKKKQLPPTGLQNHMLPQAEPLKYQTREEPPKARPVATIDPGRCPHCRSYRYQSMGTHNGVKNRKCKSCWKPYAVRMPGELVAEKKEEESRKIP